VDNDFSGNMIDVCPVGALTDKTFRFKSRVWFTKPLDAHRDCDKCCGKATLYTWGGEILRVSARKDEYNEVEDFICNTCRFDKKEMTDWKIEGPRKFSKYSVINQNNYTTAMKSVEIDTPDTRLFTGREEDRKAISMINPI
jgi:NADH-quinone oxidoreductase subunit G